MKFIHQLVEHDGKAAFGRCGVNEDVRRLPGTFTGWQQDVTCPGCLAMAADWAQAHPKPQRRSVAPARTNHPPQPPIDAPRPASAVILRAQRLFG